MDQDAVVIEKTESGKRLIQELAAADFVVPVSFWAKPTEDGKWYLYLASPSVDPRGAAMGYTVVLDLLRQMPDLWIDPFEIKVIGIDDSLTQAVLAAMRTAGTDSSITARNTKPFPGMTRVGGAILGGISIDGAYIYPPFQPAA